MRYVLIAVLLAALGGCRGRHGRQAIENEKPDTARTSSLIRTNDKATAGQLLTGFYGIENNAWRWTAAKFSIVLRPPVGASQKGATLTLAFTIPEVIEQKVGGFSLAATSGGELLKRERYSKAGAYTFTADVPAAVLGKDAVTFEFEMDKALPPTAADRRELGIIVASAGLESH